MEHAPAASREMGATVRGGSFDGIAKVVDVFFNGAKAEKSSTKKSLQISKEFIRRGVTTILVEGKLYRVVVQELEARDKS